MSKAQVYTQTAMAFTEQLGLRVLTWTNFGALDKWDPSLPSWAPDWTKPFLRPFEELGTTSNFRYNASKGQPAQYRFSPRDDGFPLLCVSGIKVDSVREAGEPMSRFPVSDCTWLVQDQDPVYSTPVGRLDEIDKLSRHCGSAYGGPEGTADALSQAPFALANPTIIPPIH